MPFRVLVAGHEEGLTEMDRLDLVTRELLQGVRDRMTGMKAETGIEPASEVPRGDREAKTSARGKRNRRRERVKRV